MKPSTWLRLATLVMALTAAATGCGGSSGGATIDANPGGNPDGGMSCGAVGDTCATGAECCFGACDTGTHMCAAGGSCAAAGAACNVPTDCCNLTCVGNKCGAGQCTPNASACTGNGECCSANCVTNKCAPVVGATCTTLGNTCAGNNDCCSMFCDASHRCGNAGGPTACIATGDVCFQAGDCCTGTCNIATGQTAGTCGVLMSMGSGMCNVDGEPCTAGTTCCSRLCVPVTGAGSICQVASGCRVVGDVCQKTADCCGGAGNGLPANLGGGEVTCNLIAGSNPPIGTCSNHTGCTPDGDVCGLAANAEHDCCACQPPKINCCKRDSSGVPRCFGTPTGGTCPNGYDGTAGCCIAQGAVCAFSSECCDGSPCVPDGTGVLHCGAPMCVAKGATCTSTADCCTGLSCVIPPGAQAGTCGGTPPVSMCALAGQACSTTAPCCDPLACEAPGGTVACAAGQAGCTCYGLVP